MQFLKMPLGAPLKKSIFNGAQNAKKKGLLEGGFTVPFRCGLFLFYAIFHCKECKGRL